MHGAEIGEGYGEGYTQMYRYCWHGHGTSVHEGTPEEMGQSHRAAITIKMKQLYWCNLYKPMHWHELTKAQKEHILESHIFVEEKRDGKTKARKVVRGNKQQDYITKEDVSSPTVSAEAVKLTCMINALKD
jgi:hypothetical protein